MLGTARPLFSPFLAPLAAGATARAGGSPQPRPPPPGGAPGTTEPAVPAPEGQLLLTVVGTSDIHGHVETLPRLGAAVARLRALRAADGGGVVLLDAGDMFQGTLESNLGEGDVIV